MIEQDVFHVTKTDSRKPFRISKSKFRNSPDSDNCIPNFGLAHLVSLTKTELSYFHKNEALLYKYFIT